MSALLVAIALLFLSGLVAFAAGRSPRWCTLCGAGGAIIAGLIGLVPVATVLLGGATQSLHLAWTVPYGTFAVEVDALSAFFLLAIFGLCALAALWGSEYLLAHHSERSLGSAWFFFNSLVASMVLVVIARNAVLFLVAWETMALASFFLVTFDDDQERVCDAGWTYLVATHLGTAFLLMLFVLLARDGGSFDFDRFVVAPADANLLFLLALVGFGTKAGLIPFHVWLPEAHPAAPSHVSAVMSGVMIKTGIYGLIRVLTFLGPPPAWWGWTLIAAGVLSGIYGVVFALAQRDLKRLLAYSSVENVGIITLGLGLGLVGLAAGVPTLAVLGFAGGLLHVLNHAVFKGLLFLGAGSVMQATGRRDIDRLGGLLRRMPWTGAAFLIGIVAITALPPLNGFVSEWLIYVAALNGVASGSQAVATAALAAIGGLALVGGLALACFTNAFGIVFLGEPRSDAAAQAVEPGVAMRLATLLLAASSILIGSLAPLLVSGLAPVVQEATGLPLATVRTQLGLATASLWSIVVATAMLLILMTAIAWLRQRLLASHAPSLGPTWDCGYAAPTPRMQYSGSSFAQPLTELFTFLLRTEHRVTAPVGPFPTDASLATEAPDICAERLYRPLFADIGRGLRSVRWLQQGRVHVYVLYIALTLLILLIWKLG
jgi:formate hydrogenlyase subunit 3/multisubunit Na+/H+ antiporter MnhD subunit